MLKLYFDGPPTDTLTISVFASTSAYSTILDSTILEHTDTLMRVSWHVVAKSLIVD